MGGILIKLHQFVSLKVRFMILKNLFAYGYIANMSDKVENAS